MNKLIASTATALFLASAQITFAQSISASNPETLTNMLSESGYPTEIVTDSYGDPQIKTEIDGTKMDINFYGCTDGRNCRDIQFRASFDTSGYSVIEHAVAGVDGMSRYTFDRILARWTSAVDSFKEHIGF